MSDSEVVESKKGRGRPSHGVIKATPKKRPRAPTPSKKVANKAQTHSTNNIPAKRGRGRPKGTFKKNGADKSGKKSSSSKGRGRPPKPKKNESTEEEDTEDNEENDEDNDSGSD